MSHLRPPGNGDHVMTTSHRDRHNSRQTPLKMSTIDRDFRKLELYENHLNRRTHHHSDNLYEPRDHSDYQDNVMTSDGQDRIIEDYVRQGLLKVDDMRVLRNLRMQREIAQERNEIPFGVDPYTRENATFVSLVNTAKRKMRHRNVKMPSRRLSDNVKSLQHKHKWIKRFEASITMPYEM